MGAEKIGMHAGEREHREPKCDDTGINRIEIWTKSATIGGD